MTSRTPVRHSAFSSAWFALFEKSVGKRIFEKPFIPFQYGCDCSTICIQEFLAAYATTNAMGSTIWKRRRENAVFGTGAPHDRAPNFDKWTGMHRSNTPAIDGQVRARPELPA